MQKSNGIRQSAMKIFLAVTITGLILDFLAANIYTLINGYPWALRKQAQEKIMENKNREIEMTYRVRSKLYHHDLAKNKYVNNAAWGNITYKVCTNSLGFKDGTVRTVSLSSDKYRILFIGDSFTEGLGIEYKDTFVGLIDSELSRKGVEVLNAAVVSYCPSIYWRKIKYLIEDIGLKFNEVIVFLDLSDIDDEAKNYAIDEFGNDDVKGLAVDKDDAEEVGNKSGWHKNILNNAKVLVKNNSILAYFLLKGSYAIISNIFTNRNVSKVRSEEKYLDIVRCKWINDNGSYNEYAEKGLKKAEFYMNKLHDLLSNNGIGLTVAVYPWSFQIYCGDLNSIQAIFWKDWCIKHNVDFINFFPYFITSKNKKEAQLIIEKFYIGKEVHWNINGHRLVADVLLDFYNKRSKNQK